MILLSTVWNNASLYDSLLAYVSLSFTGFNDGANNLDGQSGVRYLRSMSVFKLSHPIAILRIGFETGKQEIPTGHGFEM